MEEKRRFGRIPFGSSVTVEKEKESYSGKLIDISLKGAKVCFHSSVTLQPDDTCRFILSLAEGITLVFNSVVMHRNSEIFGLKFVEADPDSFSHLLRLMELNTGDAEKVADELRHFGKD